MYVCISERCFVPVVICVRDNFTKRRDIMWNLHGSFYIRFVCAMHIHSKKKMCIRILSFNKWQTVAAHYRGWGYRKYFRQQNTNTEFKPDKIRVILIQQVPFVWL